MKVSVKFLVLTLKCKHRTKETCDIFYKKNILEILFARPLGNNLKRTKTRGMKYKVESLKTPLYEQAKNCLKRVS